jgi:hypothetical protein
MGGFLGKSSRWGSNAGGRAAVMPGIMKQLQGAKSEVQSFALDVFAKAYSDFPASLTRPGCMDLKPVVDYKLNELAWNLVSFPGGYDLLYKLSKKRFPDEALPHAGCYARADLATVSPALKAAVEAQRKADADAVAKKKAEADAAAKKK